MKTLASLGLMLLAATALAEDKKETPLDAAKLVGDWTYVSGVRAGEKVDKDHLVGAVAITKDTIKVPSGDKDKPFVMAYTIDAKTSPAKIDMEIKDGPVKEGKAEGLIALEGNEIKLAYVIVGAGKRPTKLESTKDNGAFFFVLKKAK
jgi:uncharacterized protein (TIGR03067 family)